MNNFCSEIFFSESDIDCANPFALTWRLPTKRRNAINFMTSSVLEKALLPGGRKPAIKNFIT
jgi:hypothetical protein